MANQLFITGSQIILLLLLAPLVQGFIKKTKALLQCRRGPGVLQPYYDLMKYFSREPVVSENTSWLTQAAPYICLTAYLVAGSLIPFWTHDSPAVGDLIAFIYLFALARFFLALAGLEPASAFGGMGSSREMMITTLVEPILVTGLFALALTAGTTDLKGIMGAGHNPAGLLSFIGLMVVIIAETGRIPVDNPDTHLELTMVHEAMLLEYAGRQVGLLHLAAMIKQTVLLTLLVHLFLPQPAGLPLGLSLGLMAGKVLLLGLVLSVIESSLAKMRLFKLPELMAGGAAFCLLAVLSNCLL
ncbi:respiratory chain complex I subunit 1 family protein [Desulforamulus ruminis]|uniref:Respiratory-chain NADH dehydrogenase, subunit 1 n=1 Tax=Desulforamulus ruminis (strain ATCC 23193 / DSM 2154 / NCIMB 8452 / DL) TaxID=696281 RepID=F6DVK7_DESRL|nr:NADH-quinone oxidoreductase subunit H [Desulforamulus ruminis]AEG61467.1 respiratory-chain NADH dehydrogenase, subunit 1 [Desulforamulus ruminis DSM 2154]